MFKMIKKRESYAGLLFGAVVFGLIGCNADTPSTAKGVTTKPVMKSLEKTQPANMLQSTDSNLAKSLLFRWWGLFEGPETVSHQSYFDDLFAEDLIVKLGPLDIQGRDKLKAVYNSLPTNVQRSHHIENIKVTPLQDNLFALQVDFIFHEKAPDAANRATRTRYNHLVSKKPTGDFVFVKITAEILEELGSLEFEPSYIENRARATINHYLGVTDDIKSDYVALNKIISGKSEIVGMFDPSKETFNTRGDGTLIGLSEISNWLSSRQTKFSRVGHEIADITVSPLGDQRFATAVTVHTQAWPLSGDKIDVKVPVKIILQNDGLPYMTIERISR